MIRACITLALVTLLACLRLTGAPAREARGAWSASPGEARGAWSASPGEAGALRFELSVRDRLRFAGPLSEAAFAGLSEAEVGAQRETPVRFRLAREAGTFTLDGSFRLGAGGGRFRFTPNARYLASLRALGVDTAELAGAERPGRALLDYALLDVSAAYVRSLQREGCREPTARAYLELKASHVTPQHLRELRDLGYVDLPASQLVELAAHGASPAFLRALAAEGYTGLSAPELVRLRIARVTPDAIREYRRLGRGRLTPEQFIASSALGPKQRE